MESIQEYNQKKQRLAAEFKDAVKNRQAGAAIGIGGKKTSNLFRDRNQAGTQKVRMADFNQVIGVDKENLTAEVGGMTTFENFVAETLKHGLMPTVVPELKSITVGGAATGIGIEATSFKYGLVHETIKELEILTGDGRILVCSPTNENKDLFFAFPNSYGTLGYALKVKISLVPIKKYVRVTHKAYSDPNLFFKDLAEACAKARNGQSKSHFIDGVAFDRGNYFLNEAEFVDEAPSVSNYKYMGIYYKSIPEKKEDFLTTEDYIWRWDTDWFWCSIHFGVQNPIIRAIAGPNLLKSTFYWKMSKLAGQYKLTDLLKKISGPRESVIQDVEIPVENAANFMDFFQTEIGIKPVWICPTQAFDGSRRFDLYEMAADKLYVNFGFWDSVASNKEDGHYNRLIEKKVRELNGKKSLYSSSYYSEAEFWQLYNKPSYDSLKAKYDPQSAFRNLYDKCVRRK